MSSDEFPTAAAAGFHMPAEWEPHERCWMAWPCRTELWQHDLPAAQQGYADVANAIGEFEPVAMLTSAAGRESAERLCGSKVALLTMPIDDSWTRDTGPNFVTNADGEIAASIFQFNAWGGKYETWRQDAAIGHRIAEYLGIPTFTAPIFMEGGGISVDGEGTMLATEQNVLHPNRNPRMTKSEAEQIFHDALGVDKVLWLPGDPDDTETDGHVDGIACFLEPGKVLIEVCPDQGVERYDNLQANLDAVTAATDARGRPLEIVIIEEAYEAEMRSDIFCRSYINFYIANDGIVLPGFGIERDAAARALLQELFPDREVVQLDICDFATGGGGIHCITQQQPAAGL